MDIFRNLVICCLAIFSFYHVEGFEMVEDQIQVSEFDVIPGGQTLSVKKDWEEAKFSCNFTYQAQGGTKETWVMGMSINNEHTQFSCSVERQGSTSYLFFQSFRMEIYGARVAEGHVKGPDHSPLKPEEYFVDEVTSSVSQVDGKFQSMMGNVVLYGERPKDEL